MKNKTILISLFTIIALVQLYVPAKMIYDSEDVLNTGTEFKFEAAPVDPNDPFRGKYIALSYKETRVKVDNTLDWERKEPVYVVLEKDKNGFAKIKVVSKEKPENTFDFVKATISYIHKNKSNEIEIAYSFDRYYMEESKAPKAETIYNESFRDTTNHTTYALVYIKDGEAVLDDVLIDEISIKDIVKNK